MSNGLSCVSIKRNLKQKLLLVHFAIPKPILIILLIQFMQVTNNKLKSNKNIVIFRSGIVFINFFFVCFPRWPQVLEFLLKPSITKLPLLPKFSCLAATSVFMLLTTFFFSTDPSWQFLLLLSIHSDPSLPPDNHQQQ